MTACRIVLTVVIARTGLPLSLSVTAGLALLALLWATAHVVACLELTYPLTRHGRLRAAAAQPAPARVHRCSPRGAQRHRRSWHTAHTGETDRQ